jgi:outer membrane protein OmpA-like peptidoglycan-associated protein
MIARIATCALFLLLTACGGLPGNVVVLIPDENGDVGKAMVTSKGSTVSLDGAFAGAETKPGEVPAKIVATTKEQVDKEFAGALAATPRPPTVFRVFFGNARADLDAKALAVLDKAIASANATPHADISVVGHTDALGSNTDENMPLSLHRADAVRSALVSAGIPKEVIDIAYFGANDPLVPNRPGLPEPLNRRVEITIR